MTAVLVTGASGMLGRAVAQALIVRGDEVTVMQRRSSGRGGAAALGCREMLGDITDQDAVRRAVRGQDAVIHLAAKVDVSGRWADYRAVNIDGTKNLLHAALNAGAGRFVHISSPSVAHAGRPLIGAGAQPAEARSTRGYYARSKALAEQAALQFNGADLAVMALRPHLVWGPGDTQLIARVVARARARRLVIVGSGAALIDTTYVTNAADALVAGLDRCTAAAGEALVISNGEPRPLAEIVARVCAAAGIDRRRPHVPYPVAWAAGATVDALWAVRTRIGRPGEPPLTRFVVNQMGTAHWFAQQRTRAVLQWTPRVDLETGFAELARHYAAQR